MNAPTPELIARHPSTRVRLRTLAADDLDEVLALLARHDHPARSRAGLQWALLDNPTRESLGADPGWVLQSGEGIVGFIGNLPLRALIDGLAVWCASATLPVVDQPYRAHGIRLLRAFASQPEPALVHVRPTTEPLAQALDRLNFEPIEAQAGSRLLRWDLKSLKSLKTGAASGPLQRLSHWARRAAGAASNTDSERSFSTVQVQQLTADELAGVCPSHWPQTWNTWATRFWSRPGLWTDRSAYLMSWRLSDPDLSSRLALWAVHDGAGQMWGMALARPYPTGEASVNHAELLDWALLPQAPAEAGAKLLQAVSSSAQAWQASTLEAPGFNGEAAQQLEALNPQRLDCADTDVLVLRKHSDSQNTPAPLPAWSCTGSEQADWFYTDLKVAPAATLWHPARIARPNAAAGSAAAPEVTSSAFASQ